MADGLLRRATEHDALHLSEIFLAANRRSRPDCDVHQPESAMAAYCVETNQADWVLTLRAERGVRRFNGRSARQGLRLADFGC
jgi:hypothetical protein